MPTVIDELIVSLGLDSSKFQKGQKEAVDSLKKLEEQAARGGKNVEKSVGGVEESFALLQKRLIGVAALLFGGLSIDKFIDKMTKLNVVTANQAGWLGVSTQNLRSWAQAAEMAGVSGDAVAQGFGSITGQRTRWQNLKETGGLLNFQRGANLTGNKVDLFGGADKLTLRPDEEVTTRLHRWLQTEIKAGRGTSGRAALRDVGGLPEEFITMLANPNLLKLLEEAKKNAPSDKEVQNYQKLNEAAAGAAQKIELLAREMVNAAGAVPSLTEFFKFISKTIDYWNGDPDAKKKVDEEGDKLHEKLREKFGEPPGFISGPDSFKDRWDALKNNTDELRELNKSLRGGVQNQSFTGGGGAADGGGSLLHNIMYSGGGAAGGGGEGSGPRWPGGGGGGPGGDPDFGQQAGPLHGPAADYLAEKRKPFADQLNDPETRRLLGAIISAENPGAGPAVAESLMNRTELVNVDRVRKGLPPLTLKDMMLGHRSIGGGKSFYGPVRTGAIRGHLNKMGNAGFAARMNRFIDQAIGGSDLTRGHTDQGSASDPNYSSGGVGVNINRERFNDWGFPGSRAWRQQRQREMDNYAKRPSNPAASSPPVPQPDPRRALEWTNMLGASRLASYSPGANGGISTSSHITVGDVHVHTAATDGEGVAKALKPALQRFSGVMSSNNGPT